MAFALFENNSTIRLATVVKRYDFIDILDSYYYIDIIKFSLDSDKPEVE